MNGAFYVGSVGLGSQQRALDLIANNVANMNTPAFKRSEVRFSEVMASGLLGGAGRFVPGGVSATPSFAILEQGPIEATGNALDVAIEGRGFIELMGPDGQTLLWRGGRLKIGEDGLLSTQDGLALRAAITVPDDVTAVRIGRDGTVTGQVEGSEMPVELGEIEIVRIDDATALDRVEGGLYRAAEGVRTTAARPGEDGVGALLQGSIERSNVELTTEMVQMMLIQRAYSANAQVVQAADQLSGIANNLRG